MNRNSPPSVAPFAFKDCALIALATGRTAQNLKELREQLLAVDASSLFYHFWGGLLRPGFEEREYGNDLGEWAKHNLHDAVLAERLAVIDPSDFEDLESMRLALVDTVEERLDETELRTWVSVDRQFEFIRSQIVVFDTGRSAPDPGALTEIVPTLSAGSVFYHFIDARQRLPDAQDDFRNWLSAWGDPFAAARRRLAAIDPYFTTLHDLRAQIAAALQGGPEHHADVQPA